MITITSVDDIRAGRAAAPFCLTGLPVACPLCDAVAVLGLDDRTRGAQTDTTTHVCHPSLGGCNHGFTKENADGN